MYKKYYALFFVLIFSSFSYGILVVDYQLFPYDLLQDVKLKFFQQDVSSLPQEIIFENNVASLIEIDNLEDVYQKRTLLSQYIWKNSKSVTSELQIEKNISVPMYMNFENLKKIDKFTIFMEYEVNSISYLFHSKTPNGNLIIYHEGHIGNFLKSSDTIQKLLINGYDVLAFSMPLTGMNNQPVVDLPHFGKIKLTTHNHLRLIESKDFSPIKYFLEPILITLDYLDDEFEYQSYSMIGISGGGWTTTLYSAIDERISNSFSVAGSYPIYLRSDPRNFGDYEQTIPELYTISNYLELYIMSSYGENRLHMQFFNENDPCCFSGTSFKSYDELIQQKIDMLGSGNFKIFLDKTNTEHKISESILNEILSNMQS